MIQRTWKSNVSLLFALGCGISFSLLFLETIRNIATICWNDDDYSHGILLPFVAAYLIYDRRREILRHLSRETFPKTPILGYLLLVSGLLLYLISQAGNSLFASWVSLFPSLLGSLLLIFGSQFCRPLVLPVLLVFMAKPLPDSLVPRLFHPFQVFAANVSGEILDVLKVPVHLRGNIIEIPGMTLMVEEACSGMRSIMALLTVAIIIIALTPRRWFAQLFLVALSVIVAIVLNVFRVALTGVLAYFYDGRAATGFFHGFSGMIVFIVGLVILYCISKLFDRFEIKDPKQGGA